MDMKYEKWIPVKGYEDSYAVSNYGHVRSLDRFIRGKLFEGKILKVRVQKDGYLRVALCENSNKKLVGVHRLVAMHFINNRYNKPEVNHIDENKLNNRADNLEWVTPKENTAHSQRLHPERINRLARLKYGKKL